MAIYHYSHKPVSRGKGQSAVAGAAYRSAEKLYDRSIDETFDYSRRSGVAHAEIVLPTEAVKRDIQWAYNRQGLWNAAEEAERRKDSRIAREHEVALPHELSKEQQIALLRSFSKQIADRYNVPVDFALHRPHRNGDRRNFHAHIYATTREITSTGLGPKASIELSDTDRFKRGLSSGRKEIKFMRDVFEKLENEHLRTHGIEARVDCRTLKAQGIDRVPTTHLGPAVWGMERRGIETRVGIRVREQRELEARQRLERAHELGRLEREGRELSRSILDLSADLAAARAAQSKTPEREKLTGWAAIEEGQRRGREAWLAERQAEKAREVERTAALEQAIGPVVSTARPGRGLELSAVPAWTAELQKQPREWQGQVYQALKDRLQTDLSARVAAVLEKSRQRAIRRQGRVRTVVQQEPQAPKGMLGGLRRRAYEETHRAWRESLEPLERLAQQSLRQQQRLYEAAGAFALNARVREQLQRDVSDVAECAKTYEREQQRLAREHSLQHSRGKELGRDFDFER